MKSFVSLFVAALVGAASPSALAQSLADELAWAYAITPGTAPPAPVDDGTRYSLPGSEGSFTLDEIRNRQGPADWFPGDHPTMPPIVAKGRAEAGIWACSMCHYPNGKGRPENASVVGLPTEYFVQQIYDFRNGLRASAESRKPNTPLMTGFAAAMTDAEIRESAAYFSAIRWTPWIDVIETDTVPKTRILGGMHLKLEGTDAGTEPLGRRIVESPINTEHTERLRNPRSGFVAYVPRGSIARGEALARGGKTTACAVCHGENLDGLAIVPSLRGRSPSYLARQLADMKEGKRRGAWTPLMTPVVAPLTADDILNLAAYLASLEPRP
ncbi:MAG TPA: c-type cytochrome [Gammaproteobacteria bacterium]|nr:c-type cytochrome [Gammaproteobacteria bacterium]